MFDPSSILATLIANFTKLLPFQLKIINCYEQGVKFRAGRPLYKCHYDSGLRFYYPWVKLVNEWIPVPVIKRTGRTGIHFHWNLLETIKIWSIAELVMQTNYQTVTLKDNQELTVSLTICYRVDDVEKMFTNVNDFVSSLENLCQGKITQILTQYNRQEFMDDLLEICQEILDELNERVYDWGVEIKDVNFVDTPAVMSIRHFSDVPIQIS